MTLRPFALAAFAFILAAPAPLRAEERPMVAQAQTTDQQNEAALLEAAARPGAQKTASGLVYEELQPGTGAQPGPTSDVKVKYKGMFVDGRVFDETTGAETVEFPLNRVIKGWTEGLQLMKVGGKARLTIPYQLAYGERRQGTIPPRSTLVFEIELLDVR